MRIEHITKKNEYQTKLIVSFEDDEYRLRELYISKNKGRKWVQVDCKLKLVPMIERNEHVKKIYLEYITTQDIDNAFYELWQQLKPVLICKT